MLIFSTTQSSISHFLHYMCGNSNVIVHTNRHITYELWSLTSSKKRIKFEHKNSDWTMGSFSYSTYSNKYQKLLILQLSIHVILECSRSQMNVEYLIWPQGLVSLFSVLCLQYSKAGLKLSMRTCRVYGSQNDKLSAELSRPKVIALVIYSYISVISELYQCYIRVIVLSGSSLTIVDARVCSASDTCHFQVTQPLNMKYVCVWVGAGDVWGIGNFTQLVYFT